MNITYRQKYLISKLIGFISIISIWIMVGMILFSLTRSEFNFAVTPPTYPPTVISTNGGYYSNTLIIVGAGKAELNIRIYNSNSGECIRSFDKIEVSAFGDIYDRNMKIFIPPLPEGVYKVQGELFYSSNLLKTSKIVVDMGYIIVKDSDNERKI